MKTVTKATILAAALTVGLLRAAPARAWEPDPLQGPGHYTGVVRVLDFGFGVGDFVLVALSDDPASLCAARQASNADYLLTVLGPAWVRFGNVTSAIAAQWLSTLLWAKAQNIQVRVFLYASARDTCAITSFRTCADAAACAYPPPPAGP